MSHKSLIYALLGLGLLICLAPQYGQAGVITIDPQPYGHPMTGWEGTPELVENPFDPAWLATLKPRLTRLVDEVGINRIRLEIRSGSETDIQAISQFMTGQISYEDWKPIRYNPANDNDDPNHINWDGFDFAELDWQIEAYAMPMAQALQARGERLYINICYVNFREGMYFHRDPEEYAELVLATHLHLQEKFGLRPDSWEVILEPDLMNDGWTGTEIGQAIAASARRLQAYGFETKFVAPSVTDFRNAEPYFREILAVPGATDHISEVSYHRYKGATPRRLASLAELAEGQNLPLSMLEWWFGNGQYPVLHEDLSVGRNIAWQGSSLLQHFQSGEASLALDSPVRSYMVVNSLYFRNIRLGSRRIGATSGLFASLDPVAYVNPNGSYAVLAMASKATDVDIRGLPAGPYRIEIASETGQRLADLSHSISQGQELQFQMPVKGVFAVVADTSSRP
ncbi:MAG: hypothetical protein ACPGNV_05960 [Mangrovicoccus sp.]